MKNIKIVRNVLFALMFSLGLLVVVGLCLNSGNAQASNFFKENLSQGVSTLADTTSSAPDYRSLAAGIVVGLAALGGTIGMGMAISKSAEGISRQPQAEGKIRTTLMLGLVFIETLVIYALIVAILVIFVLK